MLSKKKAIFERLPVPDNMVTVEGEVRMWRAFLDQMLFDCYAANPERRDPESMAWLKNEGGQWWPDRDKLCEMAQVEPEWLELVIRRLEDGREPEF